MVTSGFANDVSLFMQRGISRLLGGSFAAPVRDGYIFDYWKGSRYEAGDEYTVRGDHTFTAQWVKDTGGSKKDSGKSSKTGDETNLTSLMALLFASAGTLGAVAYRRRRNS